MAEVSINITAGSIATSKISLLSLGLLLVLLVGCGREALQVLDQKAKTVSGKTASVHIKNYCPQNGNLYQNFFLFNASSKILSGKICPDADHDGLCFEEDNDLIFNVDFRQEDTNGDGYGDLLVKMAGIDFDNQERMRICLDPGQDTDLDGLKDCEEDVARTDYQSWDSDGDTMPDELELRYGLSPNNGLDTFQDLDGDGLTNVEEVRLATPPTETNTQAITNLALKYDFESLLMDSKECFNVTVSNIPVLNVAQENWIRMYFIEQEPSTGLSRMIRHTQKIPFSVPDDHELEIDYSQLIFSCNPGVSLSCRVDLP